MNYRAWVRTLAGAAIAFAGASFAAEPLTASGISGVFRQGAVIEVVNEGFDGTEGPLPQADGGLLFTENRAGRIVQVAPDGSTSIWHASSGGANALARLPDGRIVAALTATPAIGTLNAGEAPQVLASGFEGRPFVRPNDLIAGKLGQVYFTDPGSNPAPGEAAPPVAIYHLAADGRVQRIAADIRRPNGIVLSPDERTLYVADTAGEWVQAFDVDAQGGVSNQRNFARLAGFQHTEAGPRSGADGLAVDVEGRVYVASTAGVQVFSPRGEALGILNLPLAPQNLAFAGQGRSTLYIVGRGTVYRLPTLTRGPDRTGK